MINVKTPQILEDSGRIGSADLIPEYCPEFSSYYASKNFLCIFWLFGIILGFFSFKKRSRGMILSFIIMNFIAIIFKGLIEVTFALKEGPCSSVIQDMTTEWDDEVLFPGKMTGALFLFEYSHWNTIVTIITAILSQFSSLFLRKKSFGYEKLEPSRSFSLN